MNKKIAEKIEEFIVKHVIALSIGVLSATILVTTLYGISLYLQNKEIMEEEAAKTEIYDAQTTPIGKNVNTYIHALLDSTDDNIVFSPESMNAALDIYSELLVDEDKSLYTEFISNRDYTRYNSASGLELVNRVWINKNADIHIGKDIDIYKKGYIKMLDMKNSSKATKIKDDYVSEHTHGFITSTPTVFNNETIFDVMSVAYFKDIWKASGGFNEKTINFKNEDGSIVETDGFYTTRAWYIETDQGVSTEIPYQNGFTFGVILPYDDVELKDVDITAFIDKENTIEREAYVEIPEFEVENTHKSLLNSLGLKPGKIREDITKEGGSTNVSQVAKIVVDRTGTEAAAVSEAHFTVGCVYIPEDKDEPVRIICDRPFAFYIYDTVNNDVAFIGAIRNF